VEMFSDFRNAVSWLLVALSVYLVFIVFSPDFVLGALSAHDIEFRLSDLFLLVLIGYLVYMVVTGKKSLTFSRIFFPALAFVGTFFLGTIVAFFKLGGSGGLEATFFAIKYLEYFLIFFVTVNLVQDEEQVSLLLMLLVWLSSVAALLLIATKIFGQLHLTLTIELPSLTPQFHHLKNPRATLPFAKGFGPSAEFLSKFRIFNKFV